MSSLLEENKTLTDEEQLAYLLRIFVNIALNDYTNLDESEWGPEDIIDMRDISYQLIDEDIMINNINNKTTIINALMYLQSRTDVDKTKNNITYIISKLQ